MKYLPAAGFLIAMYSTVVPLLADVVVLHDGSSYSGRLSGEGQGDTIGFTGSDGVGFTFPIRDVQSLVFTPTTDTITLKSGRTYSGHYTGGSELQFMGSEGVSYRFPVKDISSLVLTAAHHPQSEPQHHAEAGSAAKVIPEGTEIAITTNERIDSKKAQDGQLFAATIASDVPDSSGGMAIRSGTPAKLVVRSMSTGGAVHTPELVLDLYSLNVDGRQYRTITSNVVEKGRDSVGANKRTLEYAGGGSGLGALLGGVFGGGEGAGIGALAGAGGGTLTQLFTRGKQVKVPAEATLTFHLDRTLVLRP